MTDDLRYAILKVHNNYRKQLANGQVTDGSKQNLPKGKNIYKLVSEMGDFISNVNGYRFRGL